MAFSIDFDDGVYLNLTMCDEIKVLNHIYTAIGDFNVSVKSINDDLFQDYIITGTIYVSSSSLYCIKL